MMTIPSLPDSLSHEALQPESTMTEMPESLPPTSTTVTSSTNEPVGVTPPNTPAVSRVPQQPPKQATRRTIPKSNLRQPERRGHVISKKSTASRARDTRLPSSKSTSVFDRLYKTQTAASKSWIPARSQIRKATTPRSNTITSSIDDELQVFSRLHITGTIANTSKRVTAKHPARFTPEKMKKRSQPKTPSRTPAHTPSRTPVRTPSRNAKATTSYVYSPRMKPLTKLYFDSKYHPGLGLELVEPLKLGYSFFQAFCEYENGGLDSQQIAREIILAFFKKDFPAGRHWELHEPSVEGVPGEINAYKVKMSATYDWEDGYRVASAHGVVRCQPEKKEVRVLNYVYDVTFSP